MKTVEPKFCGIYRIWHMATNKSYIGSAVDVSARLGSHLRMLNRKSHHSVKLQRAWDKYGEEAFSFNVVEVVESKEKLIEREQHWIDEFNASRLGYNISPTAGSILGHKFSDESKRKMGLAATGRIKTDETRLKLSIANTGKKMSPESREKMRIAKLGRKAKPHSAETKAKMSAARIGWRPSEETIEKMSLAKRGKKLSAEVRQRMSVAQKSRAAAAVIAKVALLEASSKSRVAQLI